MAEITVTTKIELDVETAAFILSAANSAIEEIEPGEKL